MLLETRFLVGRMDCGGCARKVYTAVRRMSGVSDVSASVAGLVTAIIGVTGLWPAILADTEATVLVTMNALCLPTPPRSRTPSV
jgi:cation transport ATPase